MDEVEKIKNEILNICMPEKIILFGQKSFVKTGNLKSLEICLVLDTDNKAKMRKRLYLEVESDVSFDVVIYTPEEWTAALEDTHSFATQILRRGIFIWNFSGEKTDGRDGG